MSPFTFLIFIAFLPLLYLADIVQHRKSFFVYAFITLLTWNAITTWWIWNSTDVGAVAAIIANSLLMTLPWWGYRVIKRQYGTRTGYIALVLFWLSFEYIHLNWQLSWPWLTLGNVFASNPNWVQWYEYTGTSGGSLWVIVINLLFFEVLKKLGGKQKMVRPVVAPLIGIVVPVLISTIILTKQTGSGNMHNVVIVQPNIDPYGKFEQNDIPSQIRLLVGLSEKQLDTSTKLVVWPETALAAGAWENGTGNLALYKPVFDFINRHPGISLLTGIETRKNYGSIQTTTSASLNERDGTYYDVFNAAVIMKANEPLQFYNKSKLVPGVESTPDFLKWMGPLFEKFGGTAGGYGRSKESAVFRQNDQPYITAPIICYESIYGEYVASYVKKGANILTIITNDGWWGNTAGHKQHLEYARLRAIETRRWVARSANTGISAVIDNYGNILQTKPWDTADAIKANIPTERRMTFYVRFGDLLSKAALLLAGLLVAWHLFNKARKKLAR